MCVCARVGVCMIGGGPQCDLHCCKFPTLGGFFHCGLFCIVCVLILRQSKKFSMQLLLSINQDDGQQKKKLKPADDERARALPWV